MATSSGLPERTGRSLTVPPPTVVVPEKAPKSVLVSGRPMAVAIMRVSNVPDAPTSVPATNSSTLLRTYPLAATVRPVNALRSEITMGTSAPPTGSTNSTPSTSATSASATRTPIEREGTTVTARATAAAAVAIEIQRPNGTTTGRVVISSCSLRNVTTDPLNETQPRSTVNALAAR